MHHELLRTASFVYKEGDIKELRLQKQLLTLFYSFDLVEVTVNCRSDTPDFHSPTEGSSTRQTRNCHNKSLYMTFIDYKVI